MIAGVFRSDYAAVLLTEEAIGRIPQDKMQAALASQPLWSDLPFVVLRPKGPPGPQLTAVLRQLGNVIQAERPVHPRALIAVIRNVLRARSRQIDARTYLKERQTAEHKLQALADGLEGLVADRTRALTATSQLLSVEIGERIAAQDRMNQMQAELIHVSRVSAMGTMASTLAHELNQPLTAALNYLRGSLRMLSSTAGPIEPPVLAGLESAASSAQRAGEIVRRLREFVARGVVDRRPEDLPRLIDEAVAVGLVDAVARGIEIEFALDPRASSILVDRVQIQQVLINLLRNAADAMEGRDRRRVSITTQILAAGTMVEVSVTDTGPGIAPDQLATLFSPFTSSKEEGMGIGLSICRTIVEANGGMISGDNLSSGGAVFRFTAPLAAP